MPDDGTATEEALAEAAGLRLAWNRHRADMLDAIRRMDALRGSFARPADPAAEPSPPYALPTRAEREGRR
ncbi:hypothetical protein GCM10009416_40480 [Craurococcus roseus]|uniref:Uncharacterized protein n=1 Tax=Craurococcus roseus TaxID=77585 RepID=A0ABN1FV16_9PROT